MGNNCSVEFNLEGTEYCHDVATYGPVESVEYFKTYGSNNDNAAIVVNKMLWYAVRLVYVDENTDAFIVIKICESMTEKDLKDTIWFIKHGLQSELGITYAHN